MTASTTRYLASTAAAETESYRLLPHARGRIECAHSRLAT
jgi:hypothetical protein